MSKQSDLLNLTDAISVSGTNVGIGTTSPSSYTANGNNLVIEDTNVGMTLASNTTTGAGAIYFADGTAGSASYRGIINYLHASDSMGFFTASTQRMVIDVSGNLLVGTTDANNNNSDGVRVKANGTVEMRSTLATANSGQSLILDRRSTDGAFINFKTAPSTTVGSIGAFTSGTSALFFGSLDTALLANSGNDSIHPWNSSTNANRDNAIDLGNSGNRFKVIYAATGSINTSDRNEKQDIDVMSEAETRVAVACKGLIRKFRWVDAVAEKGDDARIHFGIIAQDLQDAFAAEGLDASRYAMFCSDTWWEADRVVPAVEAVDATLDDEGNQLTEAVIAVAEHTVTDHYDTLEKAPEGATERTRLGVRYSELLAFIIGAL